MATKISVLVAAWRDPPRFASPSFCRLANRAVPSRRALCLHLAATTAAAFAVHRRHRSNRFRHHRDAYAHGLSSLKCFANRLNCYRKIEVLPGEGMIAVNGDIVAFHLFNTD